VRGAAIILVLALTATAAGAAYFWREIEGLLQRQDLALDPAGGGALNILLVGSDSRENISDPEDVRRFGSVGGRRADTIILAQVIPSKRRGVIVGFPRDLWVSIPGDGRTRRTHLAKINSAYGYGQQALIDTVQQITGLPINHYMEVDISGFRHMVDAIGGIDVCVPEPFYDSKLRFRLPQGANHLDGNGALSYVRARHATADGDFGRIKRQQQFLRAVMARVGKPSVLGNPLTVNELARAFASNVTVDQYFALDDMLRFAVQVKRIPPDALKTYTVPGDIGRAGGQSVVLSDEQRAAALYGALRDGVDPAERLEARPSGAAPSAPASQGGGGGGSGSAPAAQPAGPCGPGIP
jgi:LCP family protein required for cell wall assembly